MKLLLRSGLGLVLVVLLALLVTWIYLDWITQAAVEQGASYATGTTTTVHGVEVAPWAGRLGVRDVTVANPALSGEASFDSPFFLKLGQGRFAVAWDTAFSETIRLPELTLRELSLHLERKAGTSNHQIIREHLEKLSGPDKKRPEDARQFVIDRILIENVQITLHGYPGGQRTVKLSHPIELQNVGSNTDKGVVAAEVTGLILQSVFKSMLADAAKLPKALLGEVAGLLDKLRGLGDLGKQLFEDTGELLPDLGPTTQPGKDADGPVDDILGGLEKGVGDLLNSEEKETPKPAD
jgi:hypothetical protein